MRRFVPAILMLSGLALFLWLMPANGPPAAPAVSTADRIRAQCRVEASPSKRDQQDCYDRRIMALAAEQFGRGYDQRMREAGR
jgi:hypothetical protein